MIIKKTKNAITGVLSGFMLKIIAIVFPFIIRTVLLMKLGVEYIGLGSVFTSILNILNLAELGFSTAMVFSMYKPIAEDDKETICALLNTYKKIYRTIGLIVFVAGLAVLPFLRFFIKEDFPTNINIYILFAIYLSNTVIEYFFFSYQSSLLHAHQKNGVVNTVTSFVNIGMYLAQIFVIYFFSNYYVYTLFIPISTFVCNFIKAMAAKKQFPQYLAKGSITTEQKVIIKQKIGALMAHKVGNVIQHSIDALAISFFFGGVILGTYNTYMYITTSIAGFIKIIFQSITAGLGNYIEKESVEDNYSLFKRAFFVNAIIVGFCSICLICLIQPFMTLWANFTNETAMLLDFRIVVWLVALFYINNITWACATYREALGIWDKDKIRPLIVSLVNLVGTVICAYFNFLDGVIISTIVALLFVNLFWETHILFKEYFKRSMKEYFLKMLMHLSICVVGCLFTFYIINLVSLNGLIGFVVQMIIAVTLSALTILLTSLCQKEFMECFKLLKRFLTKNKNK